MSLIRLGVSVVVGFGDVVGGDEAATKTCINLPNYSQQGCAITPKVLKQCRYIFNYAFYRHRRAKTVNYTRFNNLTTTNVYCTQVLAPGATVSLGPFAQAFLELSFSHN